jgi:hypothetical protein
MATPCTCCGREKWSHVILLVGEEPLLICIGCALQRLQEILRLFDEKVARELLAVDR